MTFDSLGNLEKARRYLKAIEEGDKSFIANLFAPDALVEQKPNRIYPHGMRADVAQIAEAFEKGPKTFSRQTYEIVSGAVSGNTVVLEVLWTGTLAVPFASLAVGTEMRAHSAMFMEFSDGRIVTQRNYDCFEPW